MDEFPVDSGPVYAETIDGRFPVEPWNTFSNLVFLITIIYWLIKIKNDQAIHRFIQLCLPILGFGFIAGTIYHAARISNFWFVGDYASIFVLVLLTSLYFWQKLLKSLRYSLLAVFFILIFSIMPMKFINISHHAKVSLGYSILALIIIVPAAVHCIKFNSKNKSGIILALVFFVIALSFRQADKILGTKFLPMGTHFLWHIFGGLATFFLIKYIYTSDIIHSEMSTNAENPVIVKDENNNTAPDEKTMEIE